MVDFSSLLKKPAGQSKPPKVLVPGNYPGIIKSHEVLPAPAGKDYTAIIRFHVGLLDWPATATEDDKQQETTPGEFKPIDLSKRQLRRDFYDSSMYRLDEFLKTLGLDMTGKSYEEVLPQTTGARVVAEVQQYLNQKTNELGNQIGKLAGEQ